jgi:hypothetical protein
MNVIKKYLYFAALGLFVYMPFHIFLSQWLSTATGGLDAWKIAKDVFTAILVSGLVLTVLLTRKFTRLYLWLLGFAVIYLFLHLLLLVTTHQPHDTGLLATVYNNRLIWYLLIGYSLALLRPRRSDTQLFVRVLIVVSTVVCLIGLAQWVLPKDVMTHFGYSVSRGVKPAFFIDDKPDLPRVFSTIRDPNSLGAFLILPITILVEALLRGWRSNRRMLISGLLLLHGLVLCLTFSRSALLGAFLAVGALLVLRYGPKARQHASKLVIPAVVLVVVLLGGIFLLKDQYVVQNVVFHSDENTRQTDSNNLHLQLIAKGVEGIIEKPLGHGPGTAGLVSTHLSKGFLTENYYIQIGYEVGVLGLILFVALLVPILGRLWEARRLTPGQALIASFVGLSFMNLLLHTWSNEAVAVAWFMLAGLALVEPVNK